MKKLRIEKLTHMYQDQSNKLWYATDYEKPSYVEGVGIGYVCYAILNQYKKPISLDDKFNGEEMNVIVDADGYAFIPAFLHDIYS